MVYTASESLGEGDPESTDRLAYHPTTSSTVQKVDPTMKKESEVVVEPTPISAFDAGRHNALIPISKLPPEILYMIFTRSTFLERPLKTRSTNRLGWIKVTHVCHRWRQVALDFSALWSCIAFDRDSEWTKEMLRRSRTHTLCIQRHTNPSLYISRPHPLALPETLSPNVVDQLGEQGHRIRHLILDNVVVDLFVIVKVFKSPAPLLESLILDGVTAMPNPIILLLPPKMFADNAPNLDFIRITGCFVRWAALTFASVTYLKITYPSLATPTHPLNLLFSFDPSAEHLPHNPADYVAPKYDDFLAALTRMPLLETLILINCLPHRPPTSSAPPVVSLPHLGTLRLSTFRPSECRELLDRLVAPSCTTFDLECGADPHDCLESFHDLLQRVGVLMRGRESAVSSPIDTLDVCDLHGLELRMWDTRHPRTDDATFDKFVPASDPDVRIAFDVADMPQGVEAFDVLSCATMCSLPLAAVQTLRIEVENHDWDFEDWFEVFQYCPDVRRLCGVGQLSVTFLQALSITFGFDKEAPSTAVLRFFPRLRAVTLCAVFFTDMTDLEEKTVGDWAVQWMKDRKGLGAGLEALTLSGCIVLDKTVEALREPVAFVEVIDPGLGPDEYDIEDMGQ